MPLFVLLLSAGALLALLSKDTASPIMESTATDRDTGEAAIVAEIVKPLGLPDSARRALLTQAIDETGDFSAHYLAQTHSMFNRHKGDGELGVPDSDGFWTGRTYYVSPGDADLRIYSSFYQSARDMKQWLQERSHKMALDALKRGDASGYFDALKVIGFSTQASYSSDLKARYQNVA